MSSRRAFLGQVASGLGSLASVPRTVLGANDRIRLGVIGYGDRGGALAREAAECAGVQIHSVADVYSKRLEQARDDWGQIRTVGDHRQLLDDAALDAVLIATPTHLHGPQFVDALGAGKHVYQERAMALSVEHAKRMRAAYLPVKSRQTVQIGHQSCSLGQVHDAVRFLSGNKIGTITAINAAMYRNTPEGKPQWHRPVYPDMTPENLHWTRFLGEAAPTPFDAGRYRNWRYYLDYGGGNVTENMSQQVAFWYKVLGLNIPSAVTMAGGVYLWRDGREVPDTMTVAMEHSEALLFTWTSGFGNANPGVAEHVLGTNGTISRGAQIRYTPEKVNRPQEHPSLGETATPPRAHMQDFIDAIRAGRETSCPFDLGFRVSIACAMAVESYRQQRTVRWDAQREEIV